MVKIKKIEVANEQPKMEVSTPIVEAEKATETTEEMIEETEQPIVKETAENEPKIAQNEVLKAEEAIEEEPQFFKKESANLETHEAPIEESKEEKKPVEVQKNRLGSIGIVASNVAKKDAVVKDLNKTVISDSKQKILKELEEHQKNHEILWARVTSAIYDKDSKGNRIRVGISCLWDSGVEVVIPDYLYFPSEKAFDYDYKDLSDDEKIINRQKAAMYQVNALVCFTIINVSQSEQGLRIIGNRLDALSILKDYYFIHENFEATKENSLKVGDVTIAHVLSVRPQKVLVECMGVETFIDAYNLSNSPVQNCKDVVQPGDVIKVRIKKIHKNDGGEPYLTVVGRLNAAEQEISKIDVGTVYLGHVSAINQNSNTFTVRLTNGVNVSVSMLSLPKEIKIIQNQAIVVRITKKNNHFVMGRVIEFIQ